MNLRQKLAQPFDGLRTETLNELEKIADNHAIGFATWLCDAKDAKELLEQYKNHTL